MKQLWKYLGQILRGGIEMSIIEKKGKFSALEVANYLVLKGIQVGEPISPMKLQKLLYFVNGWYAVFHNEVMLREKFAAWYYGPVIPVIYRFFREYSKQPIKQLYKNNETGEAPMIDNAEVVKVTEKIWDIYGDYSATQLSNLTHLDETPWSEVQPESNDNIREISNKSIIKYFNRLYQEKAIA